MIQKYELLFNYYKQTSPIKSANICSNTSINYTGWSLKIRNSRLSLIPKFIFTQIVDYVKLGPWQILSIFGILEHF